MLLYLHTYIILHLTANWAICCRVNCAFDYMPELFPEKLWFCQVISPAELKLSLTACVMLICHFSSHGVQLYNMEIFFFFPVISWIAWDLWVQKTNKPHAWSKFHHFMEMAIPSIHSCRDLSSTLSPSSCHYNPFVKPSFQQPFGSSPSVFLHFNALLSREMLKLGISAQVARK